MGECRHTYADKHEASYECSACMAEENQRLAARLREAEAAVERIHVWLTGKALHAKSDGELEMWEEALSMLEPPALDAATKGGGT